MQQSVDFLHAGEANGYPLFRFSIHKTKQIVAGTLTCLLQRIEEQTHAPSSICHGLLMEIFSTSKTHKGIR